MRLSGRGDGAGPLPLRRHLGGHLIGDLAASGLTDSGEVSIPADDFVPPGFAAAEVFVEPNLLACPRGTGKPRCDDNDRGAGRPAFGCSC
jgi:hypothetical protein